MARLTVAAVDPVSALPMIMIVSAPSDDRCAANAYTTSGFGTDAATLVSPNVERFPS